MLDYINASEMINQIAVGVTDLRSNLNNVDHERLHHEMTLLQRPGSNSRRGMEDNFSNRSTNMTDDGSSDQLGIMYEILSDQFEALKMEYEGICEEHRETVASFSAVSTRLEAIQIENDRLRDQYDDTVAKLKLSCKERQSLQQHMTTTMQAANYDKNTILHELQAIGGERHKLEQQLVSALADKAKIAKDLARLTEERNDALHENLMIMSERSIVHKEIEQLQDTVTDLRKKLAVQENEKQVALKEAEQAKCRLAEEVTSRGHKNRESNEDKDFDEEHSDEELINNEQQRWHRFRGGYSRLVKDSNKEIANLRRELEKMESELMG